SGPLADRSGNYWRWALLGYGITAVSVPLLGWSGAVWVAAALIVVERFGKAVRSPSKDALLAHATAATGRGKGFAVHKALDQFGAVLGPLAVAGAMALFAGRYGPSLSLLAIPGAASLAVLAYLRRLAPRPADYELAADQQVDSAISLRETQNDTGLSAHPAGQPGHPARQPGHPARQSQDPNRGVDSAISLRETQNDTGLSAHPARQPGHPARQSQDPIREVDSAISLRETQNDTGLSGHPMRQSGHPARQSQNPIRGVDSAISLRETQNDTGLSGHPARQSQDPIREVDSAISLRETQNDTGLSGHPARQSQNPNQQVAEAPGSSKINLPGQFWLYAVFAGINMTGFATFGLIAFHLVDRGLLREGLVPLLYAGAMAVDALMAVVMGVAYDRFGPKVLVVLPLICGFLPALAFSGSMPLVAAGVLAWGAAMAIQESTIRAVVADLIPASHRATAFGLFAAVTGTAIALGGGLAGLLYQTSVAALVLVTAVLQLAALATLSSWLVRQR
ncbi:MAG: MFS transporter, partial [Micrococcales bacterium]|nr:MFS transporter [Micrococcales bacterium]